jgi:hypothetical protein
MLLDGMCGRKVGGIWYAWNGWNERINERQGERIKWISRKMVEMSLENAEDDMI